MRIEYDNAARADILLHGGFIAETSIDIAARFPEAVVETIRLVAGAPAMGREVEWASDHLRGLRWVRVRGFPSHLLFYVPSERCIRIVRVLHGSRDLPRVFGPDRDM